MYLQSIEKYWGKRGRYNHKLDPVVRHRQIHYAERDEDKQTEQATNIYHTDNCRKTDGKIKRERDKF